MGNKLFLLLIPFIVSCAAKKNDASNADTDGSDVKEVEVRFNSDSAYSYVESQVEFGPRISNTPAHRIAGNWLAGELHRHGAAVHIQETVLRSADGVDLQVKNIMGQFNPSSGDRLLLLAHWDTRPWADEDPDERNRTKAPDGANDGASGVGVLLEIARILGEIPSGRGVDILFVDAEDRGVHNDDTSWALGARYFANTPIFEGYVPSEVILLDMVGAKNACFAKEQFSMANAPALLERVWRAATDAGYTEYFRNLPGGAVTDDHLSFLEQGIPAIDIIDFRPDSDTGFAPGWHTMSDNMSLIDRSTLNAVGQTLLQFIYGKY